MVQPVAAQSGSALETATHPVVREFALGVDGRQPTASAVDMATRIVTAGR